MSRAARRNKEQKGREARGALGVGAPPDAQASLLVAPNRRPLKIALVVVAGLLAAAALAFSAYWIHSAHPRRPVEPFFTGLGSHTRKITTSSADAQRYFDQGLAFLYGFNHDEAIRSFEAAAQCDPSCAMAFWGIATASAEYMFTPAMSEARVQAALSAVATARSLESGAAPVERELIEALAVRYADPPPADRLPLDRAYYTAMRRVWKLFPDDGDVGALTAQALMLTQRGKQWTLNGDPLPDTETLVELIDRVLAKSPQHPFALHLLIHATEASRHPEKADAAADFFRDYAPGLAHLTHMPSHIDIRRGRWAEALAASEKAVAADRAYRALVHPEGFHWVMMAHNNHMLAYAAAMQGQSEKATRAIRDMLADYFPEEIAKQYPAMVDGFYAMPFEIDLRFGRWDAMLAERPPPANLPFSTAMWHFARGVAFAAKGQVPEAKGELNAFEIVKQAVPQGAAFRYTPADQLLQVAEHMLAGEILYRDGKTDQAVAALKSAIEREDNLPYSEPPDWFQPVRHTLASVLLDKARYAEAEAVCLEDLKHHPENGWSLFGLAQSLRKQKKTVGAAAASARLKKVWENADFKLTAPCLCVPAKE